MNAKRLVLGALALLGVIAGSACSPFPVQVSPEIHGRVIDAATGAPVAGAEIVVRDFRDYVNPKILAAARSASDGRFAVTAVRNYERPLISAGLDSYAIPVRMEIAAPGYEQAKQEIASDKPWTGTIELHRLAATN